MSNRPHPFTMVFGTPAPEAFASLQSSLSEAAVDEGDRDAFLLHRGAAQLIRDLEPDEGMGEAVAQLAAFVHHAYLYWRHGERTIHVERNAAERLLSGTPGGDPPPALPAAWYVQLPRQLVWGQLADGDPYQPLDGCFVARDSDVVRVLGVFGVHSDRMGFSVAEVEGPAESPMDEDADRSRFSPRMDGAEQAGLYSVNSGDDLLVLARRAGRAAAALWADSATPSTSEIVLR